MAAHCWYSCVSPILAKLELLCDPVEYVYMAVMGFFFSAALLNNGTVEISSSSNGKMTAKDLSLVTIADEISLILSEWNLLAVFEWVVGADKLLETVTDKLLETVTDKLLATAVDRLLIVNRLEFGILVVDRLVTASLVSKQFDLNLGNDSEFGTSDQGFCIDFLIVGCYKYDN
ncbi:hypothetical protein G9A89_017243 [Geosiphon pyriformis]|nr:hypothetical protein G9A89_017243 [Geosiphon pyriformis]